MDLHSGDVEVIGQVKGYRVFEDAAYLVYHRDAEQAEAGAEDGAKAGAAEGGEQAAEPSGRGERGARPRGAVRRQRGGEGPPQRAAEQQRSRGEAGRRGRFGGRRGSRGNPVGRDEAPADPMQEKRRDGTELVIRNLADGTEQSIADVVGYGVTNKSAWLYFYTQAKEPDENKTYGLFARTLDGELEHTLVEGLADFTRFTSDRSGKTIAFLSNKADFAAEKPRNDVWLWTPGAALAERIIHATTEGMPADKLIGSNLSFSRDASVLMLTVRDKSADPLPEILASERVVLDLWHWEDGSLQTQQARRGRGRGQAGDGSFSAAWHRTERRLQVLGDEQLPSMRLLTADGSRALATDGKPYEKEVTWDGRYSDVYVVNTIDGTRTRVLTKLRGSPRGSVNGRYLAWFDSSDYRWWSLDLATMQRRDLTGGLAVSFHRESHDTPQPASAHGIAGWTKDDAAVLVYDEYDIWQIEPATGQAVCVTDGLGRASGTKLRVESLPGADEDGDGSLHGEILLSALVAETMATGFYRDEIGATRKPVRLVMMDKAIRGLRKASKADRYFFNASTFAEYGDLWTCESDFSAMRKVSDANPQQEEFRWGKAELVEWTNGDGVSLKGVLVKPDGFDPNEKYPMMVYFYERLSQNLHSYVAPKSGNSPNASYYVSNGYLWFTPDIIYNTGYPGESSVKCVVSGLQHLIDQGFVDKDRIGAAGHSWGGYQTAFLVTRTNIFRAVESGAPVSNMISAYGGIRYSSGMSRQWQYEMSQSRIGGTPWEYPMRYWENSPIFFADRVRTPVLILHNDEDGAVPWTQGIEYFMALRRLGQEAYLFNYNGEAHGLRQRQNQRDWVRRMSEYFAHHLKDEPMPDWMRDGVPYRQRVEEKLQYSASYHELQKPAPPGAETVEASVEAEKPVPLPPRAGGQGHQRRGGK